MGLTKKCSKCQSDKPLEDFNKNSSKKDGLSTECKICIKEFNKTYYTLNSTKIKNTTKEYKKNNRESNSVYMKNYRKRNKVKIRTYFKQRFEQDADFRASFNSRRYVSFVMKSTILSRDSYKCCHCNLEHNLIVHHILPVQFASERVIDSNNLITLCKQCHLKVHDGCYRTYDPVWADLALDYTNKKG